MKLAVSIFLFFCISFSITAQDTIITMRGDTLSGSFSLAKKGVNEFVDFTDPNGKKQRLRLFDVKQIKTTEGEILEPIKIDKRYTFGKVIKKGYLSLHSYRSENSAVTFNQQILTNYDGNSMAVPGAFGFRKAVSRFLKACPSVSQKVEDKTLGRDELDQVIEEYNSCIKALSEKNISSSAQNLPAETEVSPSVNTKKQDFNTLLKYADGIKNKGDVSDMFNDVMQKISTNQKVPNYLRKLITEAVSQDEKLSALLKEILK
ncbi:hypothetical protein [Roseivirga sp.]|uniref:hypothetical protein n=1 Tax=Roseivirga sp. TaxID=1964215 RepID=UPI003B8C5B24